MHPTLKNIPPDDADVDEWRAWALEVHKIAVRASENLLPQRKKIKVLKKDLKNAKAANRFYKEEIKALQEIENDDGLIEWIKGKLRKPSRKP